MWIFITARLRQWLILAVIVPLVTTLVHVIRKRLEAKSGPTRVSKVLGAVESIGQQRRRR